MTREKCIQQLDSLIEHFHNGGSDFNATDVLAIKKILEQNKKYKEVIDKAIEYINGTYEMAVYTKSISLYEENIEDLLDILKEVE